MRRTTRWTLLFLPLLLVACGDSGEAGSEENTGLQDTADTSAMPQAATDPMAGATGAGGTMANTVTMQPLNNSGISGEATLSEQGGQVQVMVRLTGGQPNATYPGHVHQGTCESLGAAVVPLESVTTDASGSGTSTSTVSQPLGTLANGSHVVNYHGEGGQAVSCGPITGHSM